MEVIATKSLHTAYLLSNQKYFHNPKYDIQYTVISLLRASHCIQPNILHLPTASPSNSWNLTMIHYQIPLSNWIPTVKMLKLSNEFKNRMIVFFKYNAKSKALLYTCIYKGLSLVCAWFCEDLFDLPVVTLPQWEYFSAVVNWL